jgi:putative alpha-1,2-mannosidase
LPLRASGHDPALTRSSLHRCLQRHGISRLPEVEGDKPAKRKFKPYPIGYFHIDIAEVRTAEGKLYLYVAIDRTSKFPFVQLVKSASRVPTSAFLEALIAAVPSIGDPWLFNFVGQPWKTQAAVRAAMKKIWTNTPDGISGNDDLGEMSSWYVWSALGLYPLYPGRAELIIGSPLFPQATIHRPNATITIRGKGAAMNAPYVTSLSYDGKPWSKSWLPASFIEKSGTLTFQLSEKPDTGWASSPGDVPPSFGPNSPVK